LSGRAPEFEVERFERVPAGGGTALLRVAGRWRADSRERLPPPLLLIDDGRRSHRLAALPGPDDASPLAGPDPAPWRAAFSAPGALLGGGHLAFALETSRGIVDLPKPKEAAARSRKAKPSPLPPVARQTAPTVAPSQPTPEPAVAPAREPVALDALREERRRRETAERAAEQRRQAMAALEQRLEAERRLRGAAEQAARETRDELARMRAQTQEALRSGDRETHELAERVAFGEQARTAAEEQARVAREEIAAARAEAEVRAAALASARSDQTASLTELQEQMNGWEKDVEKLERIPEPEAVEEVASWNGFGAWAIPEAIVMCESGGNFSALNSSSGAGGAYQILPSTWDLYGGKGLPNEASPDEQHRIAAMIWADSGPSPWVCAG